MAVPPLSHEAPSGGGVARSEDRTTDPHEGVSEAEAVPSGPKRSRSPRPPSAKQKALMRGLLKSNVWTEAERAAKLDWLETKATLTTTVWMIDWLKVERFKRGGAPKAPPIHEL